MLENWCVVVLVLDEDVHLGRGGLLGHWVGGDEPHLKPGLGLMVERPDCDDVHGGHAAVCKACFCSKAISPLGRVKGHLQVACVATDQPGRNEYEELRQREQMILFQAVFLHLVEPTRVPAGRFSGTPRTY